MDLGSTLRIKPTDLLKKWMWGIRARVESRSQVFYLSNKDGLPMYRGGTRVSGEQGWTGISGSVLDVPGASQTSKWSH